MIRTIRLLTAVAGVLLVTGFALANEPQLEKKEKTKKGWLGVSIQDVNEQIAKKNKLTAEEGAYVNDVVDDGPADSAGLKEGDIIVKFGDRDIFDADDLVRTVSRAAPGSKASVLYIRNGEKKSLTVTVGKEKTRRAVSFSIGNLPRIGIFGGNTLGLLLSDLTEQLGEYFGVPDKRGVLIEEVEEASAGAKAGFKAGDVITRVEKRNVEDIEDVNKELRKHDDGDKVEFEVVRQGTKKIFSVEIDAEEQSEFFRAFPGVHPNVRTFRVPRRSSEFEFNFEDNAPLREAQRFRIDAGRIQQELKRNKRSLEEGIRKTIRIAPRPGEI